MFDLINSRSYLLLTLYLSNSLSEKYAVRLARPEGKRSMNTILHTLTGRNIQGV
ncbi:hypothetical protein ACOHYD_00350 [Desulfobacterota bacterium M19]